MQPVTNYFINILGNKADSKSALKEIVYFENASEDMLDLVFHYGKIVSLKQDELIIKEGDYDQWVYIILSGALDVYVGYQKIDTSMDSLVGERCILGESRKATLKGAEDNTILLGIDMAILDALQSSENSKPSDLDSCLELLSIILAVVYDRLSQLWVRNVGKFSLARDFYKSFKKQSIFRELVNNEIRNDTVVSEKIGFLIRELYPEGLQYFNGIDKFDSRKLFYALKKENKFKLLHQFIENISKFREKENELEFYRLIGEFNVKSFQDIFDGTFNVFSPELTNQKEFNLFIQDIFSKENEGMIPFYDMFRKYMELEGADIDKAFPLINKLLSFYVEQNQYFNTTTQQIYSVLDNVNIKELHFGKNIRDVLSFNQSGNDSTVYSYDKVKKSLIDPYLSTLRENSKSHHEEEQSRVEIPKEDVQSDESESKKFNQDDIDALFNGMN